MINTRSQSLEDVIQTLKDNNLEAFVRSMEHTFENSIYGESQEITLTLSLYKKPEETPQGHVIDVHAEELLSKIRHRRKDKDNIERGLFELSENDIDDDDDDDDDITEADRAATNMLNEIRRRNYKKPIKKNISKFDHAMDIIK